MEATLKRTLVELTGQLSTGILTLLKILPQKPLIALGEFALPLYTRIRRDQAERLRSCFASASFSSPLNLQIYYRMRLRLVLTSLRLHGSTIPADSVQVTGLDNYLQALKSETPIALLGLHAGLFELLHRIPTPPAGRPFMILTAPAFSSALSVYMAKGRIGPGKDILWNRPTGFEGTGSGDSFASGLRQVHKQKGVLALMVDQNPVMESTEEPLVLWNRITLPGPGRLLNFLNRKGFALIPVSTRLLATGKSELKFHPAWNQLSNDGNLKQSMNENELRHRWKGFLESEIASAPEQWNWSYPKIRPI